MKRLCIIFIAIFHVLVEIDGWQHVRSQASTIWNETWVDKLRQDLLAEYDTHARPNHHNKTSVEIGLEIYHTTIDEFKSAVNVRAYMTMLWNDDKMKWNASRYGGVEHFQVHKYELWEPDVLLLNGADTSTAMKSYGLVPCHIYHDGVIAWTPPVQFLALCDLDFRLWPFDTQQCTLRITSATHDANQMDLEIINSTSTRHIGIIHNTEWQLEEMTTGREVSTEECCPDDPFITLYFNLRLKRSSALYQSVIVTPTLFIIFLNLVLFWLPPDSKEKLILCGFLGFTISCFLMYFTLKVPSLMSNTPLIVIFYSGCLYQATISLILSILVINLSRKHHCRSPPRIIREILMGSAGELLGLSDIIKTVKLQRTGDVQLRESSPAENVNSVLHEDEHKLVRSSSNAINLEWILVATAIDRLSFVTFCLVFAVMGTVCVF